MPKKGKKGKKGGKKGLVKTLVISHFSLQDKDGINGRHRHRDSYKGSSILVRLLIANLQLFKALRGN